MESSEVSVNQDTKNLKELYKHHFDAPRILIAITVRINTQQVAIRLLIRQYIMHIYRIKLVNVFQLFTGCHLR